MSLMKSTVKTNIKKNMKMKSDTAIAATRCVVRRGLCLSARRTALLFSLAVIQMASADAPSWIDGLYVKGFGGLHFLQEGDLSRGAASGDGSYDVGQLFGAAIGKELTPNWALELEFFYRSADIDSISAGGPFEGNLGGDFASTNLMLNGIYTFTKPDGTALWGKLSPYAGVGIGFLQEADIDVTIGGVEQEFDDNYLFAAQVLAGVSYELSSSWSIYAETRYNYAGSIQLEPTAGGAPVEADYNGFSFLAGLRYQF